MKQHITPNQAQEVTDYQFYKLFEDIVPRLDWYKYHHKKITIGKMIEILEDVKIHKTEFTGFWVVEKGNVKFSDIHLANALWEMVKFILKDGK